MRAWLEIATGWRAAPMVRGRRPWRALRGVELDDEPRAGIGVLDPDASADRLDLALDDREAEPAAAAIAAAPGVEPVEPLEHAVLVAGGDARSAIRDREL